MDMCYTIYKLNIITQSVGYVALDIVGEKGMGCESPTIPVAVCVLFIFADESQSLGN